MEESNESELWVETTGRPSDQARQAIEAWYLSVDDRASSWSAVSRAGVRACSSFRREAS